MRQQFSREINVRISQFAADFINGSRLVYPMEGEAMRFLNLLGNIFFAKALSVVLGESGLKDKVIQLV